MATVWPRSARRSATTSPAGPAPSTITSKALMSPGHEDHDDEHDQRDDQTQPGQRPALVPELGLGAITGVATLGRLAHPVVVVITGHGLTLPAQPPEPTQASGQA